MYKSFEIRNMWRTFQWMLFSNRRQLVTLFIGIIIATFVGGELIVLDFNPSNDASRNIYLQENRQPVGYSIVNETIANDVMIKTEETTSGSDVINDKFIEFFNFSFGYKQPLNSKRNIRVEPFIKVPISNAGIKAPLTNAGVRLGIDL